MKERAYTLNTSGRSGTKRRYLNEGKSGMAAADGQTCRPAAPPSARPSAEATGLSKSQNRTHGGSCIPKRRRVTVYHGAGLLEVESRPLGDAANCSQERRRPRGKIHSWSAKSRMRCRKLLQSLDREALTNSWFVTTTYPAVFPAPDDQAIYKGHLHRLTQEIRRRHPDVSGVWKLEFQKREAAHFHFLLIGCSEDIYSFRNWIAQTWARIVNSGDPNHERVGTGVDRIRTYGGVMAYVTSYISKDDQTLPGNFTGRYWGIINREHLPRIAPTEYDVSEQKISGAQSMEQMGVPACEVARQLQLDVPHRIRVRMVAANQQATPPLLRCADVEGNVPRSMDRAAPRDVQRLETSAPSSSEAVEQHGWNAALQCIDLLGCGGTWHSARHHRLDRTQCANPHDHAHRNPSVTNCARWAVKANASTEGPCMESTERERNAWAFGAALMCGGGGASWPDGRQRGE